MSKYLKNRNNPTIRASNVIYSGGPGSFIEVPNLGTRVFHNPKDWQGDVMPSEYVLGVGREIQNAIFAWKEGDDSKMFLFPTNSSMLSKVTRKPLDSKDSVIDITKFPRWLHCYGNAHKGVSYIYNVNTRCVKGCASDNTYHYTVRYVRVCQKGHLDDIDWRYAVHGFTSKWKKSVNGKKDCEKRIKWTEEHKGLEGIKLKCETCGMKTTMKDVHDRSTPCTGHYVENLSEKDEVCEVDGLRESMYVVLKNSSSNRHALTKSYLAVAKTDGKWHRMAADIFGDILNWVISKGNKHPKDIDDFVNFAFNHLVSVNDVDPTDKRQRILNEMEDWKKHKPREWKGHWSGVIYDVWDEHMLNNKNISNDYDVYRTEFHNLQNNIATPAGSSVDSNVFNIDHSGIINNYKWTKSISLDIVPVSRITVDTVQMGYYRYPKGSVYKCKDKSHAGHSGDPVPPVMRPYQKAKSKTMWYPAIREKGEAIFLTSDDVNQALVNDDECWEGWMKQWEEKQEAYQNNKIPLEEKLNYVRYHPVWIWWHSFAHALIDSLTIDSGYASGSIRERIYFDEDSEKGGCLLYAHTPGTDGTLGGIVGLCNLYDIPKLLDNCSRNIMQCSNGGLCDANTPKLGKNNGAACYACLYVSETSCEVSNAKLDRNLIRNSI